MDIDKHFHAIFCSSFCNELCVFQIAVASAIGMSLPVVGLVPYPDTDIVHAVVGESAEDILFLTILVVELDAGLFKGYD